MRVLTALAAEHSLFRALVARLENAALWAEPAGRREIREVLLVLLPALERHETIEDLAFAEPDYSTKEGARAVLEELAREHDRVDRLRAELTEVLSSDRGSWAEIRAAAQELAARLRAHFETEERRLWPHYAAAMRRSRDGSAGRRVAREVDRLARDLARDAARISDYLGGAR
jgi:hypothetical protein